MLEEKLQPAPAVGVFPSETTARAEGGWQPCGDPASLSSGCSREGAAVSFAFLPNKGKKTPNPCKATYKSGQ